MKNGSYQRKQYLIDKPFQYKYISSWIIFAMLFMICTSGIIFLGILVFKKSSSFSWTEIIYMAHIDLIFIALAIVAFSIYLVRLSHRISGAAYRIQQSIKRISDGDYDFSIALREKDYLKHVAADMNDLIVKLRKREEVIKRLSSEVKYMLFVLSEYEDIPDNFKELMTKTDESLRELFLEKPNATADTKIWADKIGGSGKETVNKPVPE
ncbi:MAG: methyl-accepting chemotaxis protein [Candidatus Brocadiia bacterium]